LVRNREGILEDLGVRGRWYSSGS